MTISTGGHDLFRLACIDTGAGTAYDSNEKIKEKLSRSPTIDLFSDFHIGFVVWTGFIPGRIV